MTTRTPVATTTAQQPAQSQQAQLLPLLHFVVVTAVGDTVVYESSLPALSESVQLEVEFFLHASLDALDLLCREKSECFFPAFESHEATRTISAFCPIGPYRLLLVTETHSPQHNVKRDDVKYFFTRANRLVVDALRNPMAGIHTRIQSQAMRDALRQELERLQRLSTS